RRGEPANWKYPVHPEFHARDARRYVNEPRNRAKYTAEEQTYIDKKINEALERFGVAVKIKGGQIEDEAGTIQADVPINKDIDKMTSEELLLVFLGKNRLASAHGIDPAVVSVDKETETLLAGTVKQYSVLIDRQERRVEHDCVDFKTNRAVGRLFCKHLGAFLLRVDRQAALVAPRAVAGTGSMDVRVRGRPIERRVEVPPTRTPSRSPTTPRPGRTRSGTGPRWPAFPR